VRLAAVAALQQQFGRFRVLQIILRALDAAIDFLPRLDADEHQPTTMNLSYMAVMKPRKHSALRRVTPRLTVTHTNAINTNFRIVDHRIKCS
jgi:hypothetical protein